MGLFKSKKSSPTTAPKAAQEDGSSIPTNNTDGKQRKKKKFPSLLKKSKTQRNDKVASDSAAADKANKPVDDEQQQQQQQQQRDNHKETLEEDDDIGDIPRSISTPSRDGNSGEDLPPPTKDGSSYVGPVQGDEYDQDSIGSPCEAMLKSQRTATQIKNDARVRKLQGIMAAQQPPTIEYIAHYIAALSPVVSPDPSADLPSRALRCLFSLSEHSSHKQQRIEMVRGAYTSVLADIDEEEEKKEGSDDNNESSPSLVPALLSFLKRCPRDSSEQYLTLLVLNNLSIPTQNKRLIGLEFGGAKTLGRLLCEDPGCHLLVIIIVNLTFGDEKLNRDLLTMSGTSSQRVRDEDSRKEQSFLSCGGDVQLIDSLSYALLLASLTTEQLSTLGPIPLTSPEGIPHTPRKLLSLLFSLLERKLGIRYQRNGNTSPANEEDDLPPLSLGSDDCPFPETARWCLSALKNLTRPGKLSSSNLEAAENNSEEMGFLTNKDASAVAAHAILDAGIMPLLLRILKHKESETAESNGLGTNRGAYYSWQSNTAQDAALYTLMHMASVPQMRRVLREDYRGCVDVLVSILNYGKVIGERFKNAAISGGGEEGDEELGRTSLQCLKARMTQSYLILSSEDSSPSKYGSATTLGDHETFTFVDLLSHCLQGRAKEGSGAYSAATFSLKGVLHVIKCIMFEPRNRKLFASSSNGSRLNTLLLKAVARYSVLDKEITEATMDAEAVEHAVVSIYWMTLYALDESVIGFSSPLGRGTFLPSSFGSQYIEAKSVLAKIFTAYVKKDGITPRSQHAANQVLFRVNYLRFDGSVADLAYPGKNLPSESDFDMDGNLISAIKFVSVEDMRTVCASPKEYIFERPISRSQKEGMGSKVFCSDEGTSGSNQFSSPLDAAENIAAEQPGVAIDTVAIANNIAYYADGLDVYYGYVWKWEDGKGDLIERIYTAAATEDQMLAPGERDDPTERSEPYSPPRKGLLGRIKLPTAGVDDNEPFSIFGFKCGAPCGNRGY
mmetsp:Transcript_2329/g.5088  ORF Transcript_2329/g.5088 Transcript_2329/m.5088 type:complete len:1009 (-) Transcript_2329:214-3240(-)